MLKNMMKEYLGKDYSTDSLRNFLLYWKKGQDDCPKWHSGTQREEYDKFCKEYDSWRSKNDLDCLYFNGDLNADTLMSAWTPIKWVLDFINKDKGMKFYKPSKFNSYNMEYLLDERENYLPSQNELVILLEKFLILAEQRCNYILLPDRRMNKERYSGIKIGDRAFYMYDEVPPMLYYLFEKKGFGMYFLNQSGEVDVETVKDWILREKLDMGFTGEISQDCIISLIPSLEAKEPRWVTEEDEIKAALNYMVKFLERRMKSFLGVRTCYRQTNMGCLTVN